jgi:hypothetical protein
VNGQGTDVTTVLGTTVSYEIYSDASGAPGVLLFQETFPSISVAQAGGVSFVISPTSVVLVSGTRYWVSVYVTMNSASGTQEWFWNGANFQNDAAVAENPGDGFGYGCPTWSPFCTLSSLTAGNTLDLDVTVKFNAHVSPLE